jgi:hypothetical protein
VTEHQLATSAESVVESSAAAGMPGNIPSCAAARGVRLPLR